MCTEDIAKCGYCNFTRHMFWNRCAQWISEFIKIKFVFLGEDTIPSPEDCSNVKVCTKVAIRPGACPMQACPGHAVKEFIVDKGQEVMERNKAEIADIFCEKTPTAEGGEAEDVEEDDEFAPALPAGFRRQRTCNGPMTGPD